MARYENLGYCPHNSFCNYRDYNLPGNPLAMQIMDGRTAEMYYPPNDKALTNDISIVSAMLGGDGSLGVQIACFCKFNMPTRDFKEGDTLKPIRIHDVLNPRIIHPDLYCEDMATCSGWSFSVDGLVHKDSPVTYLDGLFLLEDEDYLVAIKDNKEEIGIDIWIFQKPAPRANPLEPSEL